jgi:hypothetical protein
MPTFNKQKRYIDKKGKQFGGGVWFDDKGIITKPGTGIYDRKAKETWDGLSMAEIQQHMNNMRFFMNLMDYGKPKSDGSSFMSAIGMLAGNGMDNNPYSVDSRDNGSNSKGSELTLMPMFGNMYAGGDKIEHRKGVKGGMPVEYHDASEVMPIVADNMGKSIVLDEVEVTPDRRLPIQDTLFEGITNQAANERADEFANRTSLTPGRFLGLMGANVPLAAGALGATVAAPALFDSTIAPLSDYVAGTKAGQAITGLLGNPYFNTAVEAGFAGHGLNHIVNDGVDGWGDAAMTALEVTPLGRLARPMVNAGRNSLDLLKDNAKAFYNNLTMDLNSTPGRYYHGSPSRTIEEFIPGKDGGIYFTPSKRAARGYTGNFGTGRVYEANLNLGDNPVVVDARGKAWNSIPEEEVANAFGIPKEEVYKQVGHYNAGAEPWYSDFLKPFGYNPDTRSYAVDQLVALGKDLGKSSLTIKGAKDSGKGLFGYKQLPYDQTIVYRPEQISLLEKSHPIKSNPQITTENAASMTPEQWTAAQDAAIARGDMDEAQRLRDLHFEVSAPNTVASVNGQPLQLYHGTSATFNAFDISKYGSTDGGTFGRGVYTTPVKEYAELYGKNNMPLYMKLDNPRDYRNVSIGDLMAEKLAFGDDFATGIGIDGALGRPSWKGFKGLEEYVSHNPENIKSSLSVTYDNNGVRIPLGERDNFGVNDIRYQRATDLASGNTPWTKENAQEATDWATTFFTRDVQPRLLRERAGLEGTRFTENSPFLGRISFGEMPASTARGMTDPIIQEAGNGTKYVTTMNAEDLSSLEDKVGGLIHEMREDMTNFHKGIYDTQIQELMKKERNLAQAYNQALSSGDFISATRILETTRNLQKMAVARGMTGAVTANETQLLKAAYKLPKNPKLDSSGNIEEMLAENTRFRAEASRRHGGKVMEDLDAEIDKMSDEEVLDILSSGDSYGQDYAQYIMENPEQKEKMIKNVKKAWKKVAVFTGAATTMSSLPEIIQGRVKSQE